MSKILKLMPILVIAWYVNTHWPRWDTSGPRPVSLERLQQNMPQYLGQRIRVSGHVATRMKMLGFTAYVLDDGAGHMLDVAGFSAPPEPGDFIAVTGELKRLNLGSSYQATVLYVEG